MKKNIISILAGVALLAGFSMVSISAFAATEADCNSSGSNLDVQTSANVICKYQSTDTAYGVGTGHSSGTKIYESSNAMGGIYYQNVATGNVTSAAVRTPVNSIVGASSPTAGYSEVGK